MKYCLSSFEMKEADQYTISNFQTSLELMEEAGKACFKFIRENFSKEDYFLVVVGSGNNGGDGYVIARLLKEDNYNVDVFEVSSPKTQEALINKEKFGKDPLLEIPQKDNLVIIDAIFGNGLNKNVEGKYKEIIEKINDLNKKKVISIDIASGINSDNGFVMGVAIKADITLAIQEFKFGHFFNRGKDYNKEVYRLDIGIKLTDYRDYTKILEKEDFKDLLEERQNNSNKGTYGKVTLLGGMENTPGALELAKRAYLSLKLGVGYSCVAFPKSLKEVYNLTHPEIIYRPLKSKRDGSIKFNKKEISTLFDSKVITVGMGLGVSKEVYKIISFILKNYDGILIIDADGLNSLAKFGVEILSNHKCKVILTPHLKEFSRLSNHSIEDIKSDRIRLAFGFSMLYDVYLVLKDSSTLIVHQRKSYLNVNGNSGLAKSGSGDILSGILAGIVSRGNNLLERCAFSSYILGRTCDILTKEGDYLESTITGSDIIENIHLTLKEVKGG